MPVPASPVVGRSLLRERAYALLRDAIVDGTLQPGEQLRDPELCTWLGVSRTPVREALVRLERSGLVVTLPGRSTRVSALETATVRDAAPVVAGMHALAARSAVASMTPGHLAAMRAANTAFAAAVAAQDVQAALTADDALHGVCVEVADNRVVRDVLEQYAPLLRRLERARFTSRSATASVHRHDRLIEACARGDAAGAADVAHETWATLPA